MALIYTTAGQEDYGIKLESDDVDPAFFKPKRPGKRRFFVDCYRESNSNGSPTESQAVHNFIDGVFNMTPCGIRYRRSPTARCRP
jgi:hypothetical protein